MALPSDLISQFVKVTRDEVDVKIESTVYGTIVEHDGSKYVRLDGSDLLTPIALTTDVADGERVTVMIKDHTAVVTGNISSPSASSSSVQNIGTKITEVEILVADKVSTKELDSVNGRIDNLLSDNVTIREQLTANSADIKDLTADNVTINEKLTAHTAEIENLETHKLTATDADLKYASIEELEAIDITVRNLNGDYASFKETTTDKLIANEAAIEDLDATKLTAEEADLKYANIDFSNIGEAAIEYFYATSGLIKDVTISNGTITGNLVGVTISGDLIEGNTIVAEKLVIKGEDGLYYQLNTNGSTVEAEQTEYNSLDGSVITAKSITATKINVDDLVAFDATIGGFNITDSALYSGVKTTVDNTTRGIYLDKDGQIAFGDTDNFVKFFKDSDGRYKLAISASAINLGGNRNIGDALSELEDTVSSTQEVANDAHDMAASAQESIDSLEIGGRNMLRDSRNFTVDSTVDSWQIGVNVSSGGDGFNQVDWSITDGSATWKSALSPLYQLPKGWQGRKVILSAWVYSDDWSIQNSGIYWRLSFTSGDRTVKRMRDVLMINSSSMLGANAHGDTPVNGQWTRIWAEFVLTDEYINNGSTSLDELTHVFAGFYLVGNGVVSMKMPKLEFGSRPTDWSPAVEDTEQAINNSQNTADDAIALGNAVGERVNNAFLSIDTINSVIKTLVTGQNGESLMTQTDSGWTFNIAAIQSTLDSATESIKNMNSELTDMDSVLATLKSSVDDLGDYTDYIVFDTVDGKPCIILGEKDSGFKVVITNTDIQFMEGTTTPAYISNQSMYIEKAVISDELKQGGFVWMARANGNYGLMWKGEN